MTGSARARVERRNRRRWAPEVVGLVAALFAGATAVVIHPTDFTIECFVVGAFGLEEYARRRRRPGRAKPPDPGVSEIFR